MYCWFLSLCHLIVASFYITTQGLFMLPIGVNTMPTTQPWVSVRYARWRGQIVLSSKCAMFPLSHNMDIVCLSCHVTGESWLVVGGNWPKPNNRHDKKKSRSIKGFC